MIISRDEEEHVFIMAFTNRKGELEEQRCIHHLFIYTAWCHLTVMHIDLTVGGGTAVQAMIAAHDNLYGGLMEGSC